MPQRVIYATHILFLKCKNKIVMPECCADTKYVFHKPTATSLVNLILAASKPDFDQQYSNRFRNYKSTAA